MRAIPVDGARRAAAADQRAASVARLRPGRRRGRALGWMLVGLALAGVGGTGLRARAAETADAPVRIRVTGFGLLGNREMARVVRYGLGDKGAAPWLDAAAVEDAVLILMAQASGDGYLDPRVRATLTPTNGPALVVEWDPRFEAQLPSDLRAREVRLDVRRGVRSYVAQLEFEGLHALDAASARRFFLGSDTLIRTRGSRKYTPRRLSDSAQALEERLERLGYTEAEVTAVASPHPGHPGAVAVRVQVREGSPTYVRSLSVEIWQPGATAPTTRTHRPSGVALSRHWQLGQEEALRAEQFALGFPDATVTCSVHRCETNAASVLADVVARVDAGPAVLLRGVRFTGKAGVRRSVLERRVRLKPGRPLDRVEAERSRQRLARLGVFDSVSLRLEPVDDLRRDAVYALHEGRTQSLSLLAGYGSYEQLRGGLEFEEHNMFGLAHDLRARALQSFKSTQGDLRYTVPELSRHALDLFLAGQALRREELTFTREEYGGSAGVRRLFERSRIDATLRYDYELLTALDPNEDPLRETGEAVTRARSAALVLNLARDTRDHPLLPRRGLKLFSNLEAAATALGGNVTYQRLTLGASWHAELGQGRLLHLGLNHGLALTWDADDEELPFNKRFFPGGENSVRGYQQGEATPLDAAGRQLGAETYTQANLEFEQLLTDAWSVVAFVDAVGIARDRRDYPWDESLWSIGAGLRWRTLVGPVRLEYGHNLNRRRFDPAGTLHFSIGFPF